MVVLRKYYGKSALSLRFPSNVKRKGCVFLNDYVGVQNWHVYENHVNDLYSTRNCIVTTQQQRAGFLSRLAIGCARGSPGREELI